MGRRRAGTKTKKEKEQERLRKLSRQRDRAMTKAAESRGELVSETDPRITKPLRHILVLFRGHYLKMGRKGAGLLQ
ncbi:hypothetical protein KIPB_009820, partial [Kipferlia bialata]|eukprot:g9820.t1